MLLYESELKGLNPDKDVGQGAGSCAKPVALSPPEREEAAGLEGDVSETTPPSRNSTTTMTATNRILFMIDETTEKPQRSLLLDGLWK